MSKSKYHCPRCSHVVQIEREYLTSLNKIRCNHCNHNISIEIKETKEQLPAFVIMWENMPHSILAHPINTNILSEYYDIVGLSDEIMRLNLNELLIAGYTIEKEKNNVLILERTWLPIDNDSESSSMLTFCPIVR